MAKAKTNLSKRLLAALLSVVMVFSVIPFSATMALAATDEHPNAVTLTVKDEAGNFIENAEVAFTIDSQTNGDLWKSETKQTDKNGCVELLPTADFIADDLTLTATVSKEGFETNETLVDMAITSDDQNFEVVLISKMPTGITAVGRTITYDPALKDIPAVDVQGVNTDTDTVTYTMDGVDLGTEVPTVTNVKRDADGNVVPYVITVKVEREDKELPFESGEIYTYVNPDDIQVDFSANEPLPYNEEEQELVTVEGAENIPDSSKVIWYLNDQVYSESIQEVPKAKAVGEYTVRLVIDGNPNYVVFDKEETSEISATEIGGLSAQLASGLVYNGSEQELLKKDEVTGQFVSGLKDGDTVYFMVGNSAEEVENSSAWVELTADNVPVGENAGEYFVKIKVERTNYNPTEIELNPATVTISKAPTEIEFVSANDAEVSFMQTELPKKFQYTAQNKSSSTGKITYSVELADSMNGDTDINAVAEIDSNTGELTVKSNGEIVIKATLEETDNYQSATIERSLKINTTEDPNKPFIAFEDSDVDYILGENGGITRFNNAELQNNGIGIIRYSIENAEKYGLEIYSKYILVPAGYNYAVKVNDYNKLTTAINENNGSLRVKVYATKSEAFGQAEATTFYYLNISFCDTPTSPYTLSTVDGSNGWYRTPVTVTPAEGYTIAKTEVNKSGNNFDDTIQFDDQGTNDRYVYLKDNASGAIARVKVVDASGDNLKIDSVAPDANNMTIDIEDLNIVEKIGYKFGFYNPEVNITFTVADEVQPVESGIQKFTCFYTKDKNAVGSIQNDNRWALTPKFEDGKYIATKTIKATDLETYRGCISFTATDNAGNESEEKCENTIIVVDVISPAMCADFQLADDGGKYNPVNTNGVVQHYFNGAVDFTLTINEQNFFAEDITITVTRDGQSYKVVPTWTQSEQNDEIYYGKFKLSDDGDYVVKVEYTDGSNNAMPAYQSEIITIDTQAPCIQAIPDEQEQNITIKINERNFRASDITVGVEAYDIKGNPVIVNDIQAFVQNEKNWVDNGNTHTLVLESSGENKILTDAIYDLSINYNDLSANSVDTVSKIEQFVVDHTAPTEPTIEYITTPWETFINVVTFGYYNPSVTVRFTSYDTSAGVESFTWNYTKENGASDINRETDTEATTVTAVQDDSELNKFTATTTLPDTDATQLRGYLTALATDAYGNSSDKFTEEGYVLVVDTISPTMTVEYSKESRMVGTTAYYNGDATVTFTVNEANFFPEDVVVSVSKDGGTPYSVTPNWIDKSVDEHIGTYTLSGDGDYVVYVKYHDRSQNDVQVEGLSYYRPYQDEETEYVEYASHTITIDTIKPVIDVEYQNTNLIDTVKDRDGNDRKYFDDTQTAVVTINEHNFNSKDVNFVIVAKDVTGKELDVSAWNTNPEWRTGENDDIHFITITYPGDANYTFDVDCSDLATNQSDDYAPDYFTVDKTAPTDLTVSYSTSVLDTILESLSFGFYNANMTVTLTADDITSGVHNFKYSYLNAAGVSTVNAELIDQAIDAANIEYSKDGLTATATFEIPKMVLGNDNQFNGTVEFTAYDRADNETNQKDTKRIVVDNIAPTATVQYNTPVNEAGGISYYDGNINATVTITEANFYANDVQVMVAKDGGAPYAVTPSWTDNSVDTHTGTFTLTEDGDYIITINYRDKSTNQMQTYTSNQLTIDTDIQDPTYSINGVAKTNEGGAYKNDATVAFSFEDQNFDTKTIKLERTRFNSVEDVTDEFIRSSDTNKGGSGSFEIPSEVENDGIYVLTISMTDKANHTTESSLKFTINRYGSVYEYSDYLTELLEKQYIKIDGNNSAAITQDLVITEYNANQILTDSLNILITRDGEAIDTQYTSNPTVDGNAGIGESGWYQYEYTIAKENFAEDGVYKITLTSAYAADDSDRNESTSVPENSMDAAGNQILNTMDFTVDTTKPEIRNIVNLDKPIVNAQTLEVGYTIVDVGGLKSIEIIVNGSTIDTITEFGDNAFNYSGNFTLNESSAAQTVQIKVTDMAGNVTDTASDDFSTNDLYIFNDTITVSTNFFVRWYANQPLFWGSIGGVVVLAGVIWFLIAFKRRKKDDKEAK